LSKFLNGSNCIVTTEPQVGRPPISSFRHGLRDVLKIGIGVKNAGKIQEVSENYAMRKIINFSIAVVVAGHFYSPGMQSLINQQRSKERHTEL
jgi:hypothetical protein